MQELMQARSGGTIAGVAVVKNWKIVFSYNILVFF